MKRETEKRLLTLIVVIIMMVTGFGLMTQVRSASNHFISPEEKVVKIGLIVPLTGNAKLLGSSTENAFKLALEQCEYKVGDYKIEYVVADDRNEADEALRAAQKLILQDKVDCIIGSVNSTPSIAISELANKSGIVQISCTASNPNLTVNNGKRKQYIFRTCFSDYWQGKGGSIFALNDLKAQTAAVMFDKGNDSSKLLAEAFKSNFEAGGGKVKYFEAFNQQDIDFSEMLGQISRADVDVIYLPNNYQQVSLIGKQARYDGVEAIFLGGDNWDSPYLDYEGLEGSYFTTHYPPASKRPGMQTFISNYKEKYGQEPDSVAILAYDGTNLIIDAIKRGNSSDPDKIQKAISSTRGFEGVSGTLTMGRDGNPIKTIPVIEIRSGDRVLSADIAP